MRWHPGIGDPTPVGWLTVAAWSEVRTSRATGSLTWRLPPTSTVLIARGWFPKIDPSIRLPPSANEP